MILRQPSYVTDAQCRRLVHDWNVRMRIPYRFVMTLRFDGKGRPITDLAGLCVRRDAWGVLRIVRHHGSPTLEAEWEYHCGPGTLRRSLNGISDVRMGDMYGRPVLVFSGEEDGAPREWMIEARPEEVPCR